MLDDVRYAVRQLVKSPSFTIIAVFALALGIGANTAIFSVVNAVLLRPLPYPDSEKLILLRERLVKPGGFESGSVSYLNYLDWRAAQHSFLDLGLVRAEDVNLSAADAGSRPERIRAARVTANYLSILRVPPRLGRDFVEKDDQPGAARVVLISERLWRNRFGALPLALGQRLNVDGVPREIVGVVSERVRYPRDCDIFVPLADLRADHDFLSRGNHEAFSCLGRLKPGVTLQQAGADLDIIASGLAQRYPDSNAGRQVAAKLLLEFAVGEYRYLLHLLLAAVGCVLLIACANVANLLLARGLSRSKELAVRAALGASRWRLARQVLIETGVIAVLGGCLAALIAVWSLDTIRAIAPANVSRFQETSIDLNVLFFTTGIVVFATFLVGIWPALRVSNNVAMASQLHANGARGSDGVQRQRARSVLVIVQVALAVVLLAAAGLTLKSFQRAEQVPLGFNPSGVLSMSVALPVARYQTPNKITRFCEQLIERIKTLPGVTTAAFCTNAPFTPNEWDSSFHITGTPADPPGQEPVSEMSIVSPDYFRVLEMSMLQGRAFNAQDLAGHQLVMIIDERAAQRFFPGQDPVGKQIDDPVTVGEPNQIGPPITIIGIVAHSRRSAPGERMDARNLAMMYFAGAQFPRKEQRLMVRVSPGHDPHALINAIKQEIAAIDPEQAVSDVATIEENIADSLASRRLSMTLLGVFAALALGLASIGLYGVMALTVTQRTRELGIRLALGADRARVFRLVLGQGFLLVGIGLIAGLLLAASTGRALASILYNVSVWDLTGFFSAAVTLVGVALIACCVPARRATRVDPIIALRTE
ncbi:MAG TPA: ABC transporter permease [Candidatus Udaeobacter sp.]|nr:ABC transporter permease [Candidatus Udaeobacter sp.]